MKETITNGDVIAVLTRMAGEMESAKDYLCELDSIGDGDQGVTMSIGFRAIRDVLPQLEGQDIGTIIARSGMTFNSKAASTIGALLATACMRAGREAKGLNEVGLAEVVKMWDSAIVGVKERGKANVGDKTILDMMVPTAESLRQSLESGIPLGDALVASLHAADEGVKSTIPMRSSVGRASWLADRTVGHQDAGATSFYLMWKSAVESLTQAE